MKTKRILLVCVTVFLAVVAFFLWQKDVRAPISQEYKPGIPVEKQNFENWRIDWEKQRQQ